MRKWQSGMAGRWLLWVPCEKVPLRWRKYVRERQEDSHLAFVWVANVCSCVGEPSMEDDIDILDMSSLVAAVP